MTALSFMRVFFRTGRNEHHVARSTAAGRKPRIVNLESLRVSAPESMDDRRERIRNGRVAEMTERQAGL
jgi:hypothetical protein